MSIFVNDADEHFGYDPITDEEMETLLQLSKKFFIKMRSEWAKEGDEGDMPVAWLEGAFGETNDGVGQIKLVVSNAPDFFNRFLDEETDDNEWEFEPDEDFYQRT